MRWFARIRSAIEKIDETIDEAAGSARHLGLVSRPRRTRASWGSAAAAAAMAKVVFLDIDGVCHQVDDPRGPFRPKCMMQLKKLVHGSGAEDGRKMMASVTQRSRFRGEQLYD